MTRKTIFGFHTVFAFCLELFDPKPRFKNRKFLKNYFWFTQVPKSPCTFQIICKPEKKKPHYEMKPINIFVFVV